MAEASKEKKGDDDLSMEEILQSIRRIIAEDDGDKKAPDAKANGAKKPDETPVHGSDVLELTEMLKDDGTTVSLKPEPKIEAAAAAPAAGGDILGAIDEALAKPAEKPAAPAPAPAAEKPVEKAAEKPAEKPAAPAAPVVAAPPPSAQDAIDSLLSSDVAAAASASFQKLKTADSEPSPVVTTPAPSFRSGVTVEDMVTDMLRPMMKQWLDTNLPAIVERIVEREVKKLTK